VKTKSAFIAILLFLVSAALQSSISAQGGNKTRPPFNKKPIIGLGYLPDLRITKVTINGSKASVEIANRCKGPAPHSRLALHLYQGATKDSGEAVIFGFDVPPIAAGAKTTVSIDLAKLGGVTYTFEGKYYRFEADPDNKIKETVENNNWFEKNVVPFPDSADSCELPPPPPANALPDLRITKVTVSGGRMDVEITNQCLGNAGANRLHLNLYGGPSKQSGSGEEMEADVPAINGGATAVVTFDLKAYSSKYSTFGDKYYRLDVDVYNKIKETIENNNWWEKGTVPFPDAANSCNKK
jgi:hypothetical protein